MVISSLRVDGRPVTSANGSPIRQINVDGTPYSFAAATDAIRSGDDWLACPDGVNEPLCRFSLKGNTAQETGQTTRYDIHGFTKPVTQIVPDMDESADNALWWSKGNGKNATVIRQSASERTVRFETYASLTEDLCIIGQCDPLTETYRSHVLFARQKVSAVNVQSGWYAFASFGGRSIWKGATSSYIMSPPFTAPHITMYVYREKINQNSQITFSIEVFDLTADFGAGNEPATVAECEAYYGPGHVSRSVSVLHAESPVRLGNHTFTFSGSLAAADVLSTDGTVTQNGVSASFTPVLCEAGLTATDAQGFPLDASEEPLSLPSPAFPRLIDYTYSGLLRVRGKNLWGDFAGTAPAADEDGNYTLSGTGRVALVQTYFPPGTYTVSCTKISGQAPDFRFLKSGATVPAKVSASAGSMTNGGRTVTITEEAAYCEFRFSSASSFTFRDMQIERSATKTAYEPHRTVQSLSFPSNVTVNGETVSLLFAKIGDACDELTVTHGQVLFTSRTDRIISYNGEPISTAYLSSLGGLYTGATVFYLRPTPVTYDLSETPFGEELLALYTNEGETTVTWKFSLMPSEVTARYFRRILPQVP